MPDPEDIRPVFVDPVSGRVPTREPDPEPVAAGGPNEGDTVEPGPKPLARGERPEGRLNEDEKPRAPLFEPRPGATRTIPVPADRPVEGIEAREAYADISTLIAHGGDPRTILDRIIARCTVALS